MRRNSKDMGTDNCKHNPVSENLKSLLKKSHNKVKKNHRVIFNENRNEFFDADYIILIREDCDYDEEDDNICTCKTVNLSYETFCKCKVVEETELAPQSPKFTPPFEFVDTTLSPPEGYKDMEEMEEELFVLQEIIHPGQRTVICKECKVNQELDKDIHNKYIVTLANNSPNTQENISDELDNIKYSDSGPDSTESPQLGFDRDERLWRQQEIRKCADTCNMPYNDTENVSDIQSRNRKLIGFVESMEKEIKNNDTPDVKDMPEISNNLLDTEMMLTFKFGNRLLLSKNSLNPNSAVRQLFPSNKPSLPSSLLKNGRENTDKYLVTAESLRAFEEDKRSSLPQLIYSGKTDKSVKKVIERNSLKRSSTRYASKDRLPTQKSDNSLVDLIKQLTCNDDENTTYDTQLSKNTIESLDTKSGINKCDNSYTIIGSYSPSSSSSSSSSTSTYKKISNLFNKRERAIEMQSDINKTISIQTGSNTVDASNYERLDLTKFNATSKKQCLSPLTSCVSTMDYDSYKSKSLCERKFVTNTNISENTLVTCQRSTDMCGEINYIAPDVLTGTLLSESREELVDHNVSTLEGTETKQPDQKNKDDEDDAYGFNKRPNVQGIKSQLDASSLLQHTGSELSISSSVIWPYYSETARNSFVSGKRDLRRQSISGYQYSVPNESKETDLAVLHTVAKQDNRLYQKYPRRRFFEAIYKSNLCTYSVGSVHQCSNDKTIPTSKYDKSLSPPPQEMSRNCEQTMFYIPYGHNDRYSSLPSQESYQPDTFNVSDQNDINKEYTAPICNQHKSIHHSEYLCPFNNTNILSTCQLSTFSHKSNKALQEPVSNVFCRKQRSPLCGTIFSARSTQTSTLPAYEYYNDARSREDATDWISEEAKIVEPDHEGKTNYGINYNGESRNVFTKSLDINCFSQRDSIQISAMREKSVLEEVHLHQP